MTQLDLAFKYGSNVILGQPKATGLNQCSDKIDRMPLATLVILLLVACIVGADIMGTGMA